MSSVLLEYGAGINSRGNCDWTALITATSNGHHNTVNLILDAGADMDLKDCDGKTALMKATLIHNLGIASELVNCGPDTSITDENGFTPLKKVQNNFNDIGLILDGTEISECFLYECLIKLINNSNFVFLQIKLIRSLK